MKKWIHWSRLQWDDGSKIEFEKTYTKVKNIVQKIKEKYFLIEFESKNEIFLSAIKKKKRNKKEKEKGNCLKIWKSEYTVVD